MRQDMVGIMIVVGVDDWIVCKVTCEVRVDPFQVEDVIEKASDDHIPYTIT